MKILWRTLGITKFAAVKREVTYFGISHRGWFVGVVRGEKQIESEILSAADGQKAVEEEIKNRQQ